MSVLHFLASIRNGFFDVFFSLITHLGEELVFMAVAILYYWCVEKRRGLLVLITGFAGTALNQVMKLIMKVPRPWILDPDFQIVESAREQASGYSFPSGHTQNAVGTTGSLFLTAKKKRFRILMIVLAVLIAFSRMYLGVHTPADVMFSVGLAILLLLLFGRLFRDEATMRRSLPWICLAFYLLSIGVLIFVSLQKPENHEEINLVSGLKNAYTLHGCAVGLAAICFLDEKWIHFDTKAKWYMQIVKVVLGFGIILGIKAGLSAPLTALFGNEYIARAVRYFLIVLFGGGVWPLTFSFFSRVDCPALDRFGENIVLLFTKKSGKKQKTNRES